MTSRMISTVLSMFLVAMLIAAPAAGRGEVVDRILATVDTEVILLSDVMAELGPHLTEIQQNATSEQDFNRRLEAHVRATLDQAIDNRILYREARMAGFSISDEAVDQRLDELRSMYPSREAFQQELEEAGETLSDLRSRLRRQLLARHMAMERRDQLARAVTVTESDIAQYYQDNINRYRQQERVRCRQIFLAATPGTDEAEVARARMEQVQQELDAGADFAELAVVHSEAPGAEEGGIIGWIARGDLIQPLEEAAFQLDAGERSDIIESPNGFHILKAEAREEAGEVSLDEVRTEIEPAIRNQEAARRFERWMANLRERSRVRVFLES